MRKQSGGGGQSGRPEWAPTTAELTWRHETVAAHVLRHEAPHSVHGEARLWETLPNC